MTQIRTETVQIETLEPKMGRGGRLRVPFHLGGLDGVRNDRYTEKKQAAGEGVPDLLLDRADPPPLRPAAPPRQRGLGRKKTPPTEPGRRSCAPFHRIYTGGTEMKPGEEDDRRAAPPTPPVTQRGGNGNERAVREKKQP